MPRKATGQVYEEGGYYVARITHPDGTRHRYKLGKVAEMSRARADEIAAAMSERVREGGHVHVDKRGRGHPAKGPAVATVESFGKAWETGALYEQHGAVNRLRPGALSAAPRSILRVYVYPVIGSMPVSDVAEQDIERVMARVPASRSQGTRVNLYAMLRRLFDLAIVPGRLRKDSPVTKYVRPARAPQKLFPYLFPDELLLLLACAAVPLGRRVLYALAVYLGLRRSSLYALRWSGFDAAHRALLSKISKTGLAQYVAIDAGLVWVLSRWRMHLGDPDPASGIVRDVGVHLNDLPATLREDLRAAGVHREALFEHGGAVHHIRFHDLRATFATWAKRAGWSDGQITDRTGHLSQAMLERYMRAARTLADLEIEPFPSLVGAIPELSEADPPDGEGGAKRPAKRPRSAKLSGNLEGTDCVTGKIATPVRRSGRPSPGCCHDRASTRPPSASRPRSAPRVGSAPPWLGRSVFRWPPARSPDRCRLACGMSGSHLAPDLP